MNDHLRDCIDVAHLFPELNRDRYRRSANPRITSIRDRRRIKIELPLEKKNLLPLIRDNVHCLELVLEGTRDLNQNRKRFHPRTRVIKNAIRDMLILNTRVVHLRALRAAVIQIHHRKRKK